MELTSPVIAAILAGAMAQGHDIPQPVLWEIESIVEDCTRAGGNPLPGEDFVTWADLNGDGDDEIVVSLLSLACENAWSYFCGSAGCPVTIWSREGDEYRAVWQSWVQDFTVEDGQATVVLHGSGCPGSQGGFDGCTAVVEWN